MKRKGGGGDGGKKELAMDLKGHLGSGAFRAQMMPIQGSEYHQQSRY